MHAETPDLLRRKTGIYRAVIDGYGKSRVNEKTQCYTVATRRRRTFDATIPVIIAGTRFIDP